MSLVGARRVHLKEVSKDGVEEARAPVKNAEPVGEAADHDLTAEEIAANCARALASLRGRRESDRLEREAWETLRKTGPKLRESGNEASMMKEADTTKGRVDTETTVTKGRIGPFFGSVLVGHGASRSPCSSAEKEETEEARRMRSMLQQQWHLLWMKSSTIERCRVKCIPPRRERQRQAPLNEAWLVGGVVAVRVTEWRRRSLKKIKLKPR
ncbi:hypothetical protein FOZ63_019761, partial [Perkinsus olseni]